MTGYAAVTHDVAGNTVSVELRSVNSRFLDLIFRLPDDLRSVEPVLRERLAGIIQRGKVECRISLGRAASQVRPAVVNDGLLDTLLTASKRIAQAAPDAVPLGLADLMRWPGVLIDPEGQTAELHEQTVPVFDAALAEFRASRVREGEKLAQALKDRLERVEQMVTQLLPKVPALIEAYSAKLTERLRTALTDAGAGTSLPIEEIYARARQEVTVYALKIDVAEELERLAAHASEMRRVLAQGGSVGKRLDFLMQEFNREANTLGSKGLDLEVSRASVDLKILIEQMREQIQNLE